MPLLLVRLTPQGGATGEDDDDEGDYETDEDEEEDDDDGGHGFPGHPFFGGAAAGMPPGVSCNPQ